jgi:tetratricopeptide (TPR) repeat protein
VRAIRDALLAAQRIAEEKERNLHARAAEGNANRADEWRVQDHLAHLAAWRNHAADALRGDFTPVDDVDAFNARVFEQTRSLAPDAAVEQARASWERLLEALEERSEAELHQPVPTRADRELWSVVPGNGHLHLAEHLAFIAEAEGDRAAADAAQRWALDVVLDTFDDPVSISHAEYNLACYYAKGGRSAEALPHLRRAFELNADLRALAARDSDLDPIRTEAGFATLVEA